MPRIVKERQKIFLGDIVREGGLEYDAMTGMIEGTRASGRHRKKIMVRQEYSENKPQLLNSYNKYLIKRVGVP